MTGMLQFHYFGGQQIINSPLALESPSSAGRTPCLPRMSSSAFCTFMNYLRKLWNLSGTIKALSQRSRLTRVEVVKYLLYVLFNSEFEPSIIHSHLNGVLPFEFPFFFLLQCSRDVIVQWANGEPFVLSIFYEFYVLRTEFFLEMFSLSKQKHLTPLNMRKLFSWEFTSCFSTLLIK